MKKFSIILAAVLLIMSLSVVMLTGCITAKSAFKETYEDSENLAKNASFYDYGMKKINSFSLKDDKKHKSKITVDLGEVKSFNSITLTESNKGVKLFSIYASNTIDADYTFIYQGDTIEDGRLCFVGDVSYRYLRIIASDSEGAFKVNSIGVYNKKNQNANKLRVNSYIIVDRITEGTDFGSLDAITDLIFFGMAKFDGYGNIKFYDENRNETDDSLYVKNLGILRDAIGDRKINIIADIAMPIKDEKTPNKYANSMMDEHLTKSVESIKTFLNKYNFEGFDMDYEYPSNSREWKLYNNFLRTLDKAIPDKIISLATGPWAVNFDKDVIQLIDRVELMVYDYFDEHGYHASFSRCMLDGVSALINKGFKREQIDVGLPFYSRPLDEYEYWGDYSNYADQMGKYNNLVYYNGFDHENLPLSSPQYFNSYQMIVDKTAYAIDANLGGVMIWHYHCDLPYTDDLSLFKAINEAKTTKQA